MRLLLRRRARAPGPGAGHPQRPPHLLILDEPTNHLDVDARNALAQALSGYSGAVVVISHDRYLVELIADRLVLVADGTAQDYTGDLGDYRNMVLGPRARQARESAHAGAAPRAGTSGAARPALRKQTRDLRQAVELAEREVNRLMRDRSDIDRSLFDPAAQDQGESAPTVTELMKRRADLDKALVRAESRWLKASESLEAATGGQERDTADATTT